MTENFHTFHFICASVSHLIEEFQEHTTNVIANDKNLKRAVIVLEILIIAIAIQICISVMPYTQAEIDALSIAPPFTKYENPAFGIKFVYPSNWDLTENLTHVSVAVHPKNESDYSEMEVVVKDLSKNMTVDKYTDAVMHELKKKISNFTASNAQVTSLYGNMGNEYAKNFTFYGLYRQKLVQGLAVYTLNDNKAYILTFISKDLHFKLASEAETLIHSFEFYRNLKYTDVTIERHNFFDHGLLEFHTKFDNTYGGIGSSRIKLVDDSNKEFFWSIYHNSSIYYPNSYRMAQNSNGTWTNNHNSLNQTIEYGKWYNVRLLFNDTDVSFYLNDALVETFKRPANDSYSYLQLRTESAAVSFANVHEITSSGTSELLIPTTSWYGTQGTFMAKKIGSNPIFTLVPIYPPPGYQSIHPPLNDTNLAADKIVTGLNFPTDMAFLGPDDVLVIEKNQGKVWRIVNGTLLPEPLLDVNVANKNERGMLGIAIAAMPTLFHNKTDGVKQKRTSDSMNVFLYFTQSKDNDGDDSTNGKEPLGNRLYRYELVDNKLVNPKLLLDLPTTPSAIHNGGKIVIGNDNNVYLVVGNLDNNDYKTQNNKDAKYSNGVGGILRITQDGKVVENILGKDGYLAKYYAYGVRNGFGIDFDPVVGNLWDTENGPGYGDEINLVKPGFNSGWKIVQGIWKEQNGTSGEIFREINELENFNGSGEYRSPEFAWQETAGVTDVAFLNSTRLGKHYENDMFVGDFHNGYLYHFELGMNRTTLLLKEPLDDNIANSYEELESVIFGEGFGAITDLEVGPDGYLYVLALQTGGGDCDPDFPLEECILYSGKNAGSIFRIAPVRSYTQ